MPIDEEEQEARELSRDAEGPRTNGNLYHCFEITCTGCELTRSHTCDFTFTISGHVNRRDNSHTLFSPSRRFRLNLTHIGM